MGETGRFCMALSTAECSSWCGQWDHKRGQCSLVTQGDALERIAMILEAQEERRRQEVALKAVGG